MAYIYICACRHCRTERVRSVLFIYRCLPTCASYGWHSANRRLRANATRSRTTSNRFRIDFQIGFRRESFLGCTLLARPHTTLSGRHRRLFECPNWPPTRHKVEQIGTATDHESIPRMSPSLLRFRQRGNFVFRWPLAFRGRTVQIELRPRLITSKTRSFDVRRLYLAPRAVSYSNRLIMFDDGRSNIELLRTTRFVYRMHRLFSLCSVTIYQKRRSDISALVC